MGFGDIGIDFELRCLLGNVEQSLGGAQRSQMEILRRFRDAGIKIPSPAHEARVPGAPAAAQAAPPP